MSAMFKGKKRFIEQYRRITKEGYTDGEIMERTKAQLDEFPVPTEELKATFDPQSGILNAFVVFGFCVAFDIPVDKPGKLADLRRKRDFLKLYNPVRAVASEAEICRKMNEYCYIPQGTLHDTADAQKTSFNAAVVLAFCKAYGINVDDIFREECSGSQKHAPSPVGIGAETVDFELPNGFEGRFYGYFINSTPDYTRQGKLDQFILDIKSNRIMMTLRHFGLNDANEYAPGCIVMPGKIIHNGGGKSPGDFLAIAFNSADDRSFCTLAYGKFPLKEGGRLRFRKGAMLIHSRGGGEHMPVIQPFIFANKKIDLEIEANRTLIQGALALTNGKIRLRKSDLETFKNSETIRKYFEENPYDNAVQEYVELNETALLELGARDEAEQDELYKTLLQMRAKAVSPRLFRFPNASADRSWRCVTALGKEGPQRQDEELSQ